MDGKVNILLIEDNPADSELVSIFMKGVYAGKSNLITADTLNKGILLLENTSIDVILLDLSLPDSFGMETFKKLHAKVSNIPIIVLTGFSDERIGNEAVKLGAQDFLIKGKVKGSDLQRTINYSIERHKLLQALSAKTIELEKERQKLAEAQKLAHIGSWEWDVASKKITWSDEFFLIHGLKPQEEEPTMATLTEYIHPADMDYVTTVIRELIKTGEHATFTYRIIRKDGTVRTLYSGGEAVKSDKGDVIKVIGTGQDITERMQEEEMQKLATAATKSFNSVLIATKTGLIEWVNEGFTNLTGYELYEVKNTHGEILRKGEHTGISQDDEQYKKVIKRKKPVSYESKNYSKDGAEFWTITTLTPVLDNKGKVTRIIAIDTDITQRKKMEEDLRRANNIADDLLEKTNAIIGDLKHTKKELEETMLVKDQFLANMSHEIRTPMNAIVGFTQLLLKTNPTADQKQYIDIIKTSGANLLVIINDILNLSKFRSGKINFENIEFSLTEVVTSLTEMLLPKAKEKNLELITDMDKTIWDYLVGDPTRLSQILMNLLSNAVKFTKQGEIRIKADIAKEDNESIQLNFAIMDTGIGIPEDKLPNMFEAFTQASTATSRKYGGTGLGLAIVKQLVEQQGGTISVHSKLNKGSVFSFTLAFKKGTGKIKKKKREEKELVKALPAAGLNVLLVEDNELNAALAEKVLNDWNWKVDIAETGKRALEKMKQKNFDVVLMDIQLPEMDGYETTRRIRKDFQPPKKDIAIIAMTAHALAGEEEKCLEAGMDGYISKPFEPENLYLKILNTLKIDTQTNGNAEHTRQEILPTENEDSARAEYTKPHAGRHSDLTYLRSLAKGSNKFIIQMLNIFIEQTPHSLERIQEALANKDWNALRLIVHKIKPSTVFVGLHEIAEDVPLLENYAAERNNLDKIPALVDKLTFVCKEAIPELKEELENLNKQN